VARLAVVAALVAGGGGAGAFVFAQPAGAIPVETFVSTTGHDFSGCGTLVTPCATIGYALTRVGPHEPIVVEPGTYKVVTDPTGTSNTVPATLDGVTIESDPTAIPSGDAANTIIDATGAVYGLAVHADTVTVKGLTFENAGAAGLLVSPTPTAKAPATLETAVIETNVINDSDQCFKTPTAKGCATAVGPGDYGESMWLMSVTYSFISHNVVENGLGGGMLVSDEMGPNHNNLIEHNTVLTNALGCGITLAGHNFAAAFSSGPTAGKPDPTAGGVYNNTVEDNTSDNAGANGIGLYNFAYNNTVEFNTTSGNGGPGIVIDSTFRGADLNGNTVEGNTVGVNSITDGPGEDSPGQHTVHATQTIGIEVIALATPVTGTVIETNTVTGDYYGIFLSHPAGSSALSGNTISVQKGGVPVYIAPAPGGGYWAVGSDGGVFNFAQAPFESSLGSLKLAQPIVAMAAPPDAGGYWLAAKDGGVFALGDTNYYGSLPGLKVSVSNIVGIAGTFDGGGYWLTGSNGGVYALGDASYQGSSGQINPAKAPGGSNSFSVDDIVGIATTHTPTTPSKVGYWLAGSNGGVFAFGDAAFHGSSGQINPAVAAGGANSFSVNNIVGIVATANGGGYWLVSATGGVYAFGNAQYNGSTAQISTAKAAGGANSVSVSNIVGISATPDGGGYWLVGANGGVYAFGDATYDGSLPGQTLTVSNIVGIADTP
jgi:parallel beta-helix repeat protein